MSKFLSAILIFCCLTSLSYATHLNVLATDFYKISELKDDMPTGLAIDVLDLIAKKHKLTYKVTFLPWKRAQNFMQMKEADLIIGPYYSDERAEFLDYSMVPLYTDWMVFYHRKNQIFDWKRNFKDIQRKRIVTVSGWIYGQNFKSYEKIIKPREVGSIEQAFLMLENKRADLIAVNERNAEGILKKLENSAQFKKNTTPIDFMQGYFAFSKKSENKNLKELFYREMENLRNTGKLKELSLKYNLIYDPK